MTLFGADVTRLRELANSFDQAAEQLEAVLAETEGQLSTVPWAGPDIEAFRDTWGDLAIMVRAAADDLREAGRTARANADAQEAASAPDGSEVAVGWAGLVDGVRGGPQVMGSALPGKPFPDPSPGWDQPSNETGSLGLGMDLLRDSIPVDASPAEVAEWWNGLSLKEQIDLCKAWPLEIYHLDGIPQDLKKALEGDGPYNRMEMLEYSLDNWDNDEIDIFPNNCTNFVSRSMEAGGMELTSDWGYKGDEPWFQEGRGGIFDRVVADTNVTDSWAIAQTQRDMWVDQGYTAISEQQARPGDVIYFKNEQTGEFTHAAVIRAVGPNGEIFYAQHSPQQRVRSLDDYRKEQRKLHREGSAEIYDPGR